MDPVKNTAPYAQFHRQDFPLIAIEFTGQKETPENFAAYLQELEANYQAKKELALVFDARQALPLNPTYQAKQARWMYQNQAIIKKYCRGIAYVVPQPFLRKVLQLIFKISPNPVTFKVFKTYQDGLTWAKNQLEE
jgi:hypothetical protein